jgi:adenylyl-sulfate kinase
VNQNHIHPHSFKVNQIRRSHFLKQTPKLIWFTGLSGSGKSTLANATESKLHKLGFATYVLDGDNVRSGLNMDLGFSDEDRIENIRRVGEVAKLMLDAGLVVVSAFISPFRKERELVSQLVGEDNFLEIFVDCPLEVCEQRDVKGLYEKARAGIIKNFTGIDSPYEPPLNPRAHIHSNIEELQDSLDIIINSIFAEISDQV